MTQKCQNNHIIFKVETSFQDNDNPPIIWQTKNLANIPLLDFSEEHFGYPNTAQD